MNSFNFVARGIEAEVERQISVWESGGEVKQETYDFDAATGTLTPRRAKEEADDYRYFPEPDLVPVEPPAELVRASQGRAARAAGCADPPDRGDLDLERASVLVTGGLDALWERTVAAGAERVAAANVIANNLVAGVEPGAVAAGELARLVEARERLRGPRSTRRSGSSASPGSRQTRILRRRRSRTPTSSSRSSPASSRPTRARWRRTAAARRGCSASSSAR